MTPKQRRFIAAKMDGKNNTEAAMIATGLTNRRSAAVEGHRLLTNANTQAAFERLMNNQGVTLEKLAQCLAEGLNATKRAADGREVPDYMVQLKALNTALELKGLI